MQTNSDKSVFLIENPHTGCRDFARALRLHGHPLIPRHARPSEARAIVSKDEWGNAQKIVLVRDPVERFEAACAELLSMVNYGDTSSLSSEFVEVAEECLLMSKPVRATALLLFAQNGEGVPTELRPQSEWLEFKPDLILATRDIAQWFNVTQRGCYSRTMPADQKFRVSVQDVELFSQVYEKDEALFAKLPVWSPDPTIVRLVSGYCPHCPKKEVEELNLDAWWNVSEEEAPSVEKTDEAAVEVTEDKPSEQPEPSETETPVASVRKRKRPKH